MLIRLIADTATPHVNKPYSKRKKGEVDTETKKYRDSSYWDHALTRFYEKSVAQTHAEAIKEWTLLPDGYEYYPEGRYCDLHDATTKHIYVLRNKLNGNELRVGEGCAASHALPLEFKEYSKESFEAMKAKEREVRLTSMRALSRKYFETHQGSLEDMLDMAIKYKAFIYFEGAEQAIASLKQLISNYKSSKSAYEGQRANMVYWHRTEIQRLEELLESLFKYIPWLKTYPGFERKVRTLWNYREFFDNETKLFIEEFHSRWKDSPSLTINVGDIAVNAQQSLSGADKAMELYEQLLNNNSILEVNIANDGQLRLTLRYLYGYKDLLDDKTKEIYGFVLDALKFLQLRTDKDIERLQKHITIQALSTETGPRPADFSINSIQGQFNRMINGLWQGTGVITLEDKGSLEAYLAKIRGSKITKTEARTQDPTIEQKVAFVRTYGLLLGKKKNQDLLENIERWDNGNLYVQAADALRTAYSELQNMQINVEDFERRGFEITNKHASIKFIAQCAAVHPVLPELQNIPGKDKEPLSKYTFASINNKTKLTVAKYIHLHKMYEQFGGLCDGLHEKYMARDEFERKHPGLARIVRLIQYQTTTTEDTLAIRSKYAAFLKASVIPASLLKDPELTQITVSVSDTDLASWTKEIIITNDIRLLLETARTHKLLLKEEYTRLNNFFTNTAERQEILFKQYIHNLLQGTNHIEQTIPIIRDAQAPVHLAKVAAEAISKVKYHDALIDKARTLFSYWRDHEALAFCALVAQELIPYTTNKTTALLLRILHDICAFTDEQLLVHTATHTPDLELLTYVPLNILQKAHYQKADMPTVEQQIQKLTDNFLWQANYASLREKVPQLYALYASAVNSNRPDLLTILISCLPLGLSSVWSKTYSGNWYGKLTAMLMDAFAQYPDLVLEKLLIHTKNIRKISGPAKYKNDYLAGLLEFLSVLIDKNDLTNDTPDKIRNILNSIKDNYTQSFNKCSIALKEKYGK